ncbi:MAG TPA: pyridoxamine 5'-phosphate oxidase family protein [Candidatus Saccharimonadales bacterium]
MTVAEHILETISYATIATASDNGEPWNTPVFYAHDGFTIYWSSHPDAVHSKNIAANGKAFVAIYNSKAGKGEGTGLYIRAKARALDSEDEIRHALDLLGARRGRPFLHAEKFKGNGPQRVYVAEPLKIWTNAADRDSDGDFIRDFRISAEVNPD